MITKLYIIRHGQSSANVKGLFAGHFDAELSEKGHSQAEITAEYLKGIHADVIYSSDLSRAYETALHTANKKGMKVIKSEKLREIYGGDWEAVPFNDLPSLYPEDFGVWLADVGLAVCTNGESVAELTERVSSYVEEIARENMGKSIFIFTHATPVRCLKSVWDNIPAEELKDVPWVSNASVTYAEYDGNKFNLISYGYDDFMGDMVTSLPSNV